MDRSDTAMYIYIYIPYSNIWLPALLATMWNHDPVEYSIC